MGFYEGVLRWDFDECSNFCQCIKALVGSFQYEIGRAVFFIISGIYVYPMCRLSIFKQDRVVKFLGATLGVKSIAIGVFLLVFDVALNGCIQGSKTKYAVK